MAAGDVHAAAVAALAAGLSVVPAAADGSKAPWPDGPRWARYQQQPPSAADIDRWFAGGHYGGLGVVCGTVSGHLEMLEFEGRAVDEGLWGGFLDAAEDVGLAELVDRVAGGYLEETPTGGLHLFYRCPTIAGNLKLARRPATDVELAGNPADKIKVLIETRGEGGFAVTAPSNGTTHPTGRPWILQEGGFDTISTISAAERADLHALARSFDRVDTPQAASAAQTATTDGEQPGDEYNRRTGWAELLERHGWVRLYERGDVGYWRRPGKPAGISATTNALGTDRLKVFSTSTAFDTETTYDRFGAYALLEHGGDLGAAASTLRKDGYGTVITRPLPAPAAGGPSGVADDIRAGDGDGERYECTDLGNARRLVAAHGQDLRHVPEWGTWLAWDGRRWRRDILGETYRRAKNVVEGILTEAGVQSDGDRRKELAKHWMRSQNVARIEAMIRLAATEPGIPVEVLELDGDPWTLNVANGQIDLRTGQISAHDRTKLITKLADVTHDPKASCPAWLAFLDRITAGQADLQQFLQRAVGYSLTGSVAEQILLFCHGSGANGKTTFTRVLEALLGDYAIAAAPGLLISGDAEHPTAIADLAGVRLAVCQEVDEGRRMAEALVKQLTGGDLIKARFMRQDFFSFQPTHTLWLCANHKPTVRGTDHAIWRRIRLVPFAVTIPAEEQDPHLADRLHAELSGILNWALEGCLAWQRDGLRAPESVLEATAGYRDENDVVGRFIEERCHIAAGLQVAAKDLREAYVEWCEEVGERAMSQRAFAPHLRERGLESVKDHRRHSWWTGIALANGSREDFSDQAIFEDATLRDPSNHYPHSAPAQSPLMGKGSDGSRRVADPTTDTPQQADTWTDL